MKDEKTEPVLLEPEQEPGFQSLLDQLNEQEPDSPVDETEETSPREELEVRARKADVSFRPNLSDENLLKRVLEAENPPEETEAPAATPDATPDEDPPEETSPDSNYSAKTLAEMVRGRQIVSGPGQS